MRSNPKRLWALQEIGDPTQKRFMAAFPPWDFEKKPVYRRVPTLGIRTQSGLSPHSHPGILKKNRFIDAFPPWGSEPKAVYGRVPTRDFGQKPVHRRILHFTLYRETGLKRIF
jgi:hypothetical protein